MPIYVSHPRLRLPPHAKVKGDLWLGVRKGRDVGNYDAAMVAENPLTTTFDEEWRYSDHTSFDPVTDYKFGMSSSAFEQSCIILRQYYKERAFGTDCRNVYRSVCRWASTWKLTIPFRFRDGMARTGTCECVAMINIIIPPPFKGPACPAGFTFWGHLSDGRTCLKLGDPVPHSSSMCRDSDTHLQRPVLPSSMAMAAEISKRMQYRGSELHDPWLISSVTQKPPVSGPKMHGSPLGRR